MESTCDVSAKPLIGGGDTEHAEVRSESGASGAWGVTDTMWKPQVRHRSVHPGAVEIRP